MRSKSEKGQKHVDACLVGTCVSATSSRCVTQSDHEKKLGHKHVVARMASDFRPPPPFDGRGSPSGTDLMNSSLRRRLR